MHPPTRLPRRPSLERLEDRTLPAVNFGWALDLPVTGGGVAGAVAAAADPSGNVVVGGYLSGGTVDFHGNSLTAPSSLADVFLAKYSPAGQLLWSQQIGGTNNAWLAGLAVDSAGDVFATGKFDATASFAVNNPSATLSAGAAGRAGYVAKYDSAGHLLWARPMTLTVPDLWVNDLTPVGLGVDAAGDVFAAGTFTGTVDFSGTGAGRRTSQGSFGNSFVCRFDPSGNFLWASTASGTSTLAVQGVAVDRAGDVYTTGGFVGTATFGAAQLTSAGSEDAFVSRMDASGNSLWAVNLGGGNLDYASGVAVDPAGDAFVTGVLNASTPTTDFFVSRLDPAGHVSWTQDAHGGWGDHDYGMGVAADERGNVWAFGHFTGTLTLGAAGSLTTANPGGQTFLAQLDGSGNFTWAGTLTGSGPTDFAQVNAVAVDGLGRVYSAGGFRGSVDFDPGAGTSTLVSQGNNDVFVSQLLDTAPLTYTSSRPGRGSLTLRRDGADVEVVDNTAGRVVARRAFAATTNVVINGWDSGGDTLLVDFGAGSLTVPGGIAFNGGFGLSAGSGRWSTLSLAGPTNYNMESYTATGDSAGTVLFSNPRSPRFIGPASLAVSYTNVETVVDSATLSTYWVPPLYIPRPPSVWFYAPAGVNNIVVSSGSPAPGIAPVLEVMSYGAFQPATLMLSNKPTVSVNGVAGGNRIIVDATTPVGGVGTLVINAPGTGNVIYVASTPANTSVVVYAGAGQDWVYVGQGMFDFSDSLNKIQGTLTVHGAGLAAGDHLILEDRNQFSSPPPGHTYTITPGSVSRDGTAAINYDGFGSLELDADNGNNVFNVNGTAAGTTWTVYEGTGHDVVNEGANILGTLVLIPHAR